jgi:hypothetical protein
MRVQRHASGSVRYDKQRRTWNYLWYDGATRRSKLIGSKRQYPTKAAAWDAVERVPQPVPTASAQKTVREVIIRYEIVRMPTRHSTEGFQRCERIAGPSQIL